MGLDFSIFIDYGPRILDGFLLTVQIMAGAVALGLPIGVLLAVGRRSRLALVRFVSTIPLVVWSWKCLVVKALANLSRDGLRAAAQRFWRRARRRTFRPTLQARKAVGHCRQACTPHAGL